jgi:hypothetical protein
MNTDKIKNDNSEGWVRDQIAMGKTSISRPAFAFGFSSAFIGGKCIA